MSTETDSPAAEGPKKRFALPTLPEPLAAIALFVLATACAGLWLARPRATIPEETPTLVLSEPLVARAVTADAEAAREAPRTSAAKALRELFDKQGEMELVGSENVTVSASRRAQLVRGWRALVAESSEAAALRLRSEATREFDAALELKLPEARARVVIGGLANMLQREGASLDGELTAPRFVVRTLFKARWNLLCGLAPTYRFEPIELQAYFGWQALHAERLPIPQRVGALQSYAKAGGGRIHEALGVLYYAHGEFDLAAEALNTAYEATPSIRLRNYLLGARAATGN